MPMERRGWVIVVERANWVKPGGARRFSGRRQPSRGDTSRMNREVQVRICEGLGVKLPGPTRPTLRYLRCSKSAGYHTGRDANVIAKAARDPKLPPTLRYLRCSKSAGYHTGRDANVIAKAARDPKLPPILHRCARAKLICEGRGPPCWDHAPR